DVIEASPRFNPGPQAGVPTVAERWEGRAQALPLIMPNQLRLDRRAPLYSGYAPGPRGYQWGGSTRDQDQDQDQGYRRSSDEDQAPPPRQTDQEYESQRTQGARKISVPNIYGQLKVEPRQLPQPVFPSTGTGQQQPGAL